jgi:hypothetical protein
MSDQMSGSGLWSDEPDDVDLLAFSAVAETVIDAILDEALDPVAIGISGAWGSGKTTVLRLVESGLGERNLGPGKQVLIVPTDPWRYDPSVGAKETLIGEILGTINAKLAEQTSETTTGKAMTLVRKLAKRVQWAKGLKLAARTAITLQLPNPDDLTDLIAESDDEGEGQPRGLDQFRADFTELMESEELGAVAGSLRCRVTPGHGVDEVRGTPVGTAGSAGDVGFAVAAVIPDRGVAQRGEHGGTVAGAGLVGVLSQRHITYIVDSVFDVPPAVPSYPDLPAGHARRATTRPGTPSPGWSWP